MGGFMYACAYVCVSGGHDVCVRGVMWVGARDITTLLAGSIAPLNDDLLLHKCRRLEYHGHPGVHVSPIAEIPRPVLRRAHAEIGQATVAVSRLPRAQWCE